jgi:haloacetate dehalogenase
MTVRIESGTRLRCPVLAIWGTQSQSADLVEMWCRWADEVQGLPLNAGHFVMEEAPEEVALALAQFFQEA